MGMHELVVGDGRFKSIPANPPPPPKGPKKDRNRLQALNRPSSLYIFITNSMFIDVFIRNVPNVVCLVS